MGLINAHLLLQLDKNMVVFWRFFVFVCRPTVPSVTEHSQAELRYELVQQIKKLNCCKTS